MPSTPPSMNAIRKWCLDGFSVLAYQLQESEELSLLSLYYLEEGEVPQYFVHRIINYFNRPCTNMDRVKNTYIALSKTFGIELKIFIAPCHCCFPAFGCGHIWPQQRCAEVGCVLKQNTWYQDRCQRLRQTRQDKTQNHVGCNLLWFS